MDLEKVHPKFAKERKCKNDRCQTFFLSDKDEDLCPFCRSRGLTSEQERKKDVVYQEPNVTELEAKVAELEKKLEESESHRKRPTFKPKECSDCGKMFEPHSGHQRLCPSCRAKLTN